MIVYNDVDCINKCVLHDVCDSVNYRKSDKTCELNTHPAAGPNPADLISDSEWMYWSISSELLI